MKLYFERLLDNGFLSVLGAFVSSPILIMCVAFGPKVLWIWGGVWVLSLLCLGFVDPNHFHSESDGDPMEFEYR